MPDQELKCKDCGSTFCFTEKEQQFFLDKGYENTPKRCKDCRKIKRERNANDIRHRGESESVRYGGQ